MKQQHKAMFIALRDGKFDSIIEGADASQSTQSFPAATPAAPPSAGDLSNLARSKALTGGQRAGSLTSPLAARQSPSPPAARVTEEEAPQTLRQASEELALDIDAVERAAAAASTSSPSLRASADLPPPPANLFREKPAAGKYRVTSPPRRNRSGSRRGAASFGLPDSGGQGRARRCRPRARRAPVRADATCVDLRSGAAAARQVDLRRGPHQRQVARRSHPELPRRGPRRRKEVDDKKTRPERLSSPGRGGLARWGRGLARVLKARSPGAPSGGGRRRRSAHGCYMCLIRGTGKRVSVLFRWRRRRRVLGSVLRACT